jgi:transcriptional regulator with XRE-family HTH domain
MDFFEEVTLRLKQQLKVTDDKEVAAALGMSASALNMRKKRGNFPTKEVFALAAQRPELGLDPDWIVTGSSTRIETEDSREASLLQCFRKLSNRDQLRLLQTVLLWSGEMVLALPPKSASEEIDLIGEITGTKK